MIQANKKLSLPFELIDHSFLVSSGNANAGIASKVLDFAWKRKKYFFKY